MHINPKLIKNQFEKSIDTYNQNAFVQKITAEKLVLETAKINHYFENILELGCGAGLLTNELVKHIKFKRYFANDLVEKSKYYVSKIVPDVNFYCGNAQRIKPSKKMDLIISNAMFQWFENLEKISTYYKTLLNKDGILAFSTFSPENFPEIRNLTGLSLNYKSLDEIIKIFSQNFEILYSEEFKHILQSFCNQRFSFITRISKTRFTAVKQCTAVNPLKTCIHYKTKRISAQLNGSNVTLFSSMVIPEYCSKGTGLQFFKTFYFISPH